MRRLLAKDITQSNSKKLLANAVERDGNFIDVSMQEQIGLHADSIVHPDKRVDF